MTAIKFLSRFFLPYSETAVAFSFEGWHEFSSLWLVEVVGLVVNDRIN